MTSSPPLSARADATPHRSTLPHANVPSRARSCRTECSRLTPVTFAAARTTNWITARAERAREYSPPAQQGPNAFPDLHAFVWPVPRNRVAETNAALCGVISCMITTWWIRDYHTESENSSERVLRMHYDLRYYMTGLWSRLNFNDPDSDPDLIRLHLKLRPTSII